jgi:hypothetical protein
LVHERIERRERARFEALKNLSESKRRTRTGAGPASSRPPSEEAGRWFASFTCEVEREDPTATLPTAVVGIEDQAPPVPPQGDQHPPRRLLRAHDPPRHHLGAWVRIHH